MAERCPRAELKALTGFAMSRGRARHVGEALYRGMGAGARRDFTCLGTFRNLAARLEKWAPISDELIFARGACTAGRA
jgi:class 3 adenylate cyclase